MSLPPNVTPIQRARSAPRADRPEPVALPVGTLALLRWPGINPDQFPALIAALELAYGRGLQAEAIDINWIAIRPRHPAGSRQP